MPFHFWTPDTYAGAPVPVAAYLSVVSKAAGFAGLILLTGTASGPTLTPGPLLAVLAALTMTARQPGRAAADADAVRLLAWSSVGPGRLHPGAAARPHGTQVSLRKPVGASVAYLVMYAAMNLGAFAVVALGRRGPAALDAYRGPGRDRGRWPRRRWPSSCSAWPACRRALMGLFAKVVVFGAAVGAHLAGSRW